MLVYIKSRNGNVKRDVNVRRKMADDFLYCVFYLYILQIPSTKRFLSPYSSV